ncbi:sulfur carrier protein ThiS [Actinomadura citrea]|jgi:sulfur carrier protein|uniref:Sulfur carrier protein n=1 Tax=Actinomadura citrea TaxID=46158 RepID=A0A7Y9G9X3_9ACTN|nr:sulfur carrier protein ThiS [Actinomadura citrea]NYE12582.1 sulfur carrier protein [Actinomadura citrea]GGT53003.1 thiamine biosynthesis protein ThiS [Actinomadura citrea]
MKVIVNGEARELPDGASVAEVVASVTAVATGVAAALNDEVVRRAEWEATPLRDADRIEVLTAVQGG